MLKRPVTRAFIISPLSPAREGMSRSDRGECKIVGLFIQMLNSILWFSGIVTTFQRENGCLETPDSLHYFSTANIDTHTAWQKRGDQYPMPNTRRMFLKTAAAAAIAADIAACDAAPSKTGGLPKKPKSRYLKHKEKLDRCFSAVLQDVMDGMNVRIQCMHPGIAPLAPSMKMWGEAITIYMETVTDVPEKPFQMEMELLDSANEGHVIVAQCNAPELSAFWGGLLTNAAIGRKVSGIVTDGGARDYNEIMELSFPVFCRGLSPYDSLGRMDAKECDVPVECGGIRVVPGDLVFGDVDGVVVVPQEISDEVIAKAWEKVQAESTVREELRSGAGVVDTFKKYGVL